MIRAQYPHSAYGSLQRCSAGVSHSSHSGSPQPAQAWVASRVKHQEQIVPGSGFMSGIITA